MKHKYPELNLDKGLYYNATQLHEPLKIKWSIDDKLDIKHLPNFRYILLKLKTT